MTTGTRTTDLRSYQYCSLNGASYQLGYWAKVSWTGTDSVPPDAHAHNPFYKTWDVWIKERVGVLMGTGFNTYRETYADYWFTGKTFAKTSANWHTDAELLAKANQIVAGHQFNLGIATGEIGKTLAMLLSTSRRALRALKHFKAGRVVSAFKAMGYREVPGLADKKQMRLMRKHKGQYYSVEVQRKRYEGFDPSTLWLEYSYGWRPLLMDVEEAMKAVYVLTNPRRSQQYIVRKRLLQPWITTNHPKGAACFYVNQYQLTSKLHLELYEDWTPWQSLGLADPAVVAWELVPFSFVVDWFVPIGQYLEARAFVAKTKGRYYLVQRRLCQYRVNIPATITDPTMKMATGVEKWEETSNAYNRTAYTDIASLKANGITAPSFRPLSQVYASWQHCATTIALIQQLNRKG